ncbi:MAG: putative bifunctional diguanylate cyclase/phosphodiesterase [Candidatus Dormibacteria bacterium]
MSIRLAATRAVRQRLAPAPTVGQGRTAASHQTVRRVWALNALLAVIAAIVALTAVSRLDLSTPPLQIPWVGLAALFALAESWRVFVHFRRNAHSFSLSEVPLVIGLFFSSPHMVVSARLAGALVALWLVRHHPPIKVVFNLAMYALEAQLAFFLLALLDPSRDILSPSSWLLVVTIMMVVTAVGFSLTAMVISIAEGTLSNSSLVRGYGFSMAAAVVNTCLAIQISLAASQDLAALGLIGLPLLVVAGAYLLYTSEYQKRQRIQHLYECSDLLQRSAVADVAVPELLKQIAQVFRVEMAQLVLLPVATGSDRALTHTLRDGETEQRGDDVDRTFMERLVIGVGSETRAQSAAWNSAPPAVREWLALHNLKDAMFVSLWGDGALLGVLTVGNRMSDVSTFSADDRTLFETFGAQASVAVQNMRLDNTLTYQAFHDPLTGLANRVLFSDRLAHALSRRDTQHNLAVLFVDLDDFKMVNDTFGHVSGDTVLRQVAERLRSVLRPADTAARFGGDEFAILLEDAAGADEVTTVAERVVAAFRPHFVVEERELALHGSIGIAISPPGSVTAEEMLRRADAAMYWAKVQGKNGYEVYGSGMAESSGRQLQVRTELEQALSHGDLRVHYQPIVDLHSGAVHGVEALVRWEHPEHGLILPGEFIGIAEESGLIDEVGDLVLRETCRQVHTWDSTTALRDSFQVHVNMSPRQFRSDAIVDRVHAILRETGLNPRRLVLEVTESFIGAHAELARERIEQLKELGVLMAIDDFGTGYSSLSILQEMPFDIIKIDRAFITDESANERRRAFTGAIVGIGRTLGLSMVAEGVETQSQRSVLMALGCGLAQGFLFSRAVPARQLGELLTEDRRLGEDVRAATTDAPTPSLRVIRTA